jgi:hypothetical protein
MDSILAIGGSMRVASGTRARRLLVSQRSSEGFADDENGNVLRRMAAAGIDLLSPRVIDFEHRFPDEQSARSFRAAVRGTVLEVKLFLPDPGSGRGWEVQCRQRMVPTHSAITETELRLRGVARQFGGDADGWGSLSNPDRSPAA